MPPSITKNPLLWLQDKLTPFSTFEKERLIKAHEFSKSGFGYAREQSTQPQTLGYSLGDSPVGLLAWVYEKVTHFDHSLTAIVNCFQLHVWTDSYPWTDDESESQSITASI